MPEQDINLDTNNIPEHVAIIMDGNGRWARERGVKVTEGHRKGSENVETVSDYFNELGVKTLTLYAFSSENWKRSEEEISGLMRLLETFFNRKLNRLIDKKIKIKIIGDKTGFSKRIQKILNEAEEKTASFNERMIQLALNYGSRDEISRAVNKILEDYSNNKIKKNSITPAVFEKYLDTAYISDPDLLIRTGGEMRISNFLLYQIAYSELYITETFWPDFGKEDIINAFKSYQKRERRYGGRVS